MMSEADKTLPGSGLENAKKHLDDLVLACLQVIFPMALSGEVSTERTVDYSYE